MAQITLNSTGVASNGSLVLQSNGTTSAVTIDTSQRAAFVAGTAALPAITTTGDTNTGIFFPAADTIAFAEGGTEAMRLDSAGNMGLGVTPSAWGSTYRMQQIGLTASIGGRTAASQAYLSANWYTDGTNNRYITSAAATQYQQDAGVHYWFTAASGTAGNTVSFTQAMTLDASGNLGVGATSPAVRLDVGGATADVRVAPSTTTNSAYYRCVNASGQAFLGLDNSAGGLGGAYALNIWHSGAYPIALGTNNIERARITSGGDLLVGVNSGGTNIFRNDRNGDQTLYVQNTNSTSPFGMYINYPNAAPNSTGAFFISCQDNSAPRLQVRSNGGIANYSANNVNLSDRREKTNFAPAGNYLAKICAIPVQTFNYIDQNLEEDGGLTLGVVAQDVQAVAPEMVMESNWAGKDEEPKMRLSIYQTDLQYALMKSIQELKAIVDAQAVEIAALKGTA